MRLDTDAIRRRCARDGRSLDSLLRSAGVSRNAYYSLARRSSVLPRSISALAGELGVDAAKLLVKAHDPADRARALLAELERILIARPGVSRENAWHTLLLLEKRPLERLNRGLVRANARDLHR